MDTELLLYVGGLALLDMASPTLLGVTLYLLGLGRRQFGSRLAVYLLTVMLLYFLLGCALMLALELVQEALVSFFHNKLISWSIFIVGALLFIASFWIKPSSRPKKSNFSPGSVSAASLLMLGVSTFLLEAGTALPYFGVVSLMTSRDIPWTEWLFVLMAYNVLMIMPPVLIYLLYRWIGPSIQGHVEKWHQKLTKHSGSLLSWVMCIAGLLLIFNVLDYL
ncbi:GAP family protein [Paenibacillus silvae]|nr:GAP family protein [Paenibacillus silvae]